MEAPPPQAPRIDPPPMHNHFPVFLQSLININCLEPDNDWLKNIDDTDAGITSPSTDAEYPDTETHLFPFKDIAMSYRVVHLGVQDDPHRSCRDASQFIINGYKLPLDKDCQRCFPDITPSTIHRYFYKGLRFITLWGSLHQYSGFGDRIQFNYFFDITQKPYTQDIYTNAGGGRIYQPILYGALNNDHFLDRIVFDGIYYPVCMDTCMITITAETYINKKWQPLRDNKLRPYYIRVHSLCQHSKLYPKIIYYRNIYLAAVTTKQFLVLQQKFITANLIPGHIYIH